MIGLVEDAKQAWRWFSVQAMALAAALQGAWVFVPEDMRAAIPHGTVQWITIVLLALGIAGRVVKRTPKDTP